MLVQAAWSAIKTPGRLQARYHKLVRRFGGPKNPAAVKKAILAVAHTLLKIAYQVLKSGKPYEDLGARFLHPAGVPRAAPGLPATATGKAQPRLHHHPRGGRGSLPRAWLGSSFVSEANGPEHWGNSAGHTDTRNGRTF